MIEPLDLVREFQSAVGQPVSTSRMLPEDSELRSLRLRLLDEEVLEYEEAEAASDIVGVADALGDILYIAAGTALTYGVYLITMPFTVVGEAGFPDDAYTRRNRLLAMREAFSRYRQAEAGNDLGEIERTLQKVVHETLATAEAYRIPLKEVFEEIHRSNMSKLDENGNAIRRADGKILKPDHYSPPDVEGVLWSCSSI